MVKAVTGPLTEGDPRRVGPYTTVGRLGAGALGPLYAGRSDDGGAVAVRALRAELLADGEVRGCLAADIAAARTVSGRYAAPVLGADLEAETPWLASAFVAGVPLARAVADHGPLPEPALLTLAAGLAEALAALHAAGVMHGDLRPGTVLLTAEGPRIVDYALARAFDGAAEFGQAGFLAPEQATGRAVTPSADMFALGSTLFFAAAGRAPFGEGTPAEVKKRVAKSSPVLGKLPAALAELIRGCFQKDPNSRAQPRQVLEFVQRRAPIPLGNGWLPPAVAADVRAAAAADVGAAAAAEESPDTKATIIVAPAAADVGAAVAADESPDTKATIIVAPAVSGVPATGQQAGAGAAFGSPAAMPSGHIGGSGPGQPGAGSPAATMAGAMPGPAATGAPGMPGDPTGFQPVASGPSAPAPSRRNLLLALTGGAVVVAGGGTAVAVGLGGSSGTMPEAAANPAAGAAPSTALSSAFSAAPSLAAPSSTDAGRRPLPPTGALPPPAGASGTLQGPAVGPFWKLSSAGKVTSMATGEGVLVVCDEAGVSGFDLGGNPKWGPVRADGVQGSGNGVVADGVVYLIAGSVQGGPAGGALLALDVQTGAQRWQAPMPAGSGPDTRVGAALGGVVFVVGTSGNVPFLWAVDAALGATRWQKSGVQFATLAAPSDGTQVVIAGAPGPDGAGTVAAVDVRSGDQAWAHPLKTTVDYSRVSVSRAAFAGDSYVLLFADAQGSALVGGTTAAGQTRWNMPLTGPAGDAGTLALITRSPDGSTVVALSSHGIYAANVPAGRMLWQSQSTESFNVASDSGAPQIADGNVYVYDQKGIWWAVDLASGRTRWQYAVAGFDKGTDQTDPVWIAVSGGVVVAVDGKIVMVAARG